jgi:DNA polymerase-4
MGGMREPPLASVTGLHWLFLDLNSYFASVEQQMDPAIRERPVAVVPVMSDSTCAIAASHQAKACGIGTGTKIREAKRLCPGLIIRPARPDLYVEFHDRIKAEIDRHIPIAQVCSIDEVACRLSGAERRRDNAIALGRRIKRGIIANVGECLGSSVGIAPNRFLAKVASEMEKPDGLVVLDPHALPGRLLELKLRALPGIGPNMERRLNGAGIAGIADLWALDPRRARRIWGSVEGERFWYELRGVDVPVRETERSIIGHGRVLAPALRAPEPARLVARRLAQKAASRLRRLGYRAGAIDLSVRFEDEEAWWSTFRLRQTRDSFVILDGFDRLWIAMIAGRRGCRPKTVSVALHELTAEAQAMPDLLDALAPPRAVPKPREGLSAAIDGLNARFGQDAVVLGAKPADKTGYMGAKIAFTRIPDKEEFRE